MARQRIQKPAPKDQDNSQSHGRRQPFHLEFLNQAQKMAWGAFDQHDVLFLLGPAGCGKALTLTSKLYSKNGFITMGDAKIGDEIANPDGNFSKITGVFPQGEKQICRVYFSDETYVDCCEDHLWSVSHSDNGWKRVVDTKFIEKNCKRKDGKRVLSIPVSRPVNFDRKEFVVPPYLMGILLAEGNFTNSNLCFSASEKEIYEKVGSCLDEGYVYKTHCHKKSVDHRIVKARRGGKNKYKDELRLLGLWGKYAWEKSIPEQYLFSSIGQRIALLQGLMDGDGGIEKTGAITYCTTSRKLAEGFCQLVYSLGGSTKINQKIGYIKEDATRHRDSFRCYVNLPAEINIFFLNRKQRLVKSRSKYFPKRYIDRVERLDKEEMQCISVDHKDSLYLTDNYTVTHNTHLACAFAISEILAKRRKKCILTRPIVEAGESLGFLPGTFDEKVCPYMMPMYDCIEKCVGREGPQRELVDRSIEVAPIAYMRGRSQSLDSPILTPNGYVKMGDLSVGDFVIGSNGLKTKVMGVYPQGDLDVYTVKFTDGVEVECSADHLWNTTTLYERRHKKGFSTKTTTEIMDSLKYAHAFNHQIPIAKKVNFELNQEIPIDPYVLGALLGDGNLSANASVTLTSSDDEVFQEVERRLPFGVVMKECCTSRPGIAKQMRIVSDISINEVRNGIKSLGLLGNLSHSKFIPDVYKFSSIQNRLDLLRGLLDTDGCCFSQKGKRKARVQYYSTSETLAKDVAFLVHSLGGTASIREREFTEKDNHELNGREIIHNKSCWVVGIRMEENPFKLSRKSDKFVPLSPLRSIVSIEKTGRKKCQCIKVDAYDSLYLANHCVVTHNTFDNAVCIFDEAQNATVSQLKLFMTRFGENSKIIITGDPLQSDLRSHEQGLMHVVDRLQDLAGVGMIYFKSSSIVRHPLIASILEKLEDKDKGE